MKAVKITSSKPTLAQVLKLAQRDNVILRARDGREFVLAEIDDFDREVGLVRQHRALTQLLHERATDRTRFSVTQARARLAEGQ